MALDSFTAPGSTGNAFSPMAPQLDNRLSSPSAFTAPGQSSTAQTAGYLEGTEGGFLGLGPIGSALQGRAPYEGAPIPIQSQATYATPTGGTAFNPAHAAAYTAPAEAPVTSAPVTPAKPSSDLSQYLGNTTPTNGGGHLSTDGNGNPTGYNANAGYLIPGGTVGSSALSSTTGVNDVMNKQQVLQDYVDAVSKAQGYSPQYLQALQQQYGAQNQGAYLQSQGAGLNANLATGNGFTGYSQGAAQEQTGIDQNLLAQQEALNTQKQTEAGINLNTAQLARTGQISAAQTQLQYAPAAMMGVNQITSVNALSNAYPGAGILPTDSIETAQQKVSQSPAYKAQFQSTYTTAAGGTGVFSKLNANMLNQNPDGTYTLVGDAQSVIGQANAAAAKPLVDNLNTTQNAFRQINDIMGQVQGLMQKYNLNQTGVPLVTQLENSIFGQTPQGAGAVAALNLALSEAQTNLATVLGRGTSIAGTQAEAANLINPKLSPDQMAQVQTTINTYGNSAINNLQSQIQQLNTNVQSGTTGGGSPLTPNNTSAAPGSFASGTGWN